MSAKNQQLYAIIGGPASGKSLVMEELRFLGYNAPTGAARLLIEEAAERGISAKQLRANEAEFNETVLERRLAQEAVLLADEASFVNGGRWNAMAHAEANGHSVSRFMLEACTQHRYKTAFLLARLPYLKNEIRTEDPQTAERLHYALEATYRARGITVIEIPLMRPWQRADLILSRVPAVA